MPVLKYKDPADGQWKPVPLGNVLDMIRRAGDRMTGPLLVPEATEPDQVMPLGQADARYVNAAGDTVTGDLIVDGPEKFVRFARPSAPNNSAGVDFSRDGARDGYITRNNAGLGISIRPPGAGMESASISLSEAADWPGREDAPSGTLSFAANDIALYGAKIRARAHGNGVFAPTQPDHLATKGYVDGRLRFGQVDLPAWGNAEAHSSIVCRITHNYGTAPALIVPVLVSPYAVDSYPEYRYFADVDAADTDMVSMQAGFSGPNYFNVHLHMGPRAQNVTAVFKIAWFALMP